MSSNSNSRLHNAAEAAGKMERGDPIISDFIRQLRAPLTVSEFVTELHSYGDSDSENEEININPYGAYRKARERAPRSTSPPPKPIEYWEDLVEEAERVMAVLRFQDLDPPVSIAAETSDDSSTSSPSSENSEEEAPRPSGGDHVTSAFLFPILETSSQKVDAGATVASVVGSNDATKGSQNLDPGQGTTHGADGHREHRQHSEGNRNNSQYPMFQAVTETSWARLERQRAQSVWADGHPVGEDERRKGHHGRHKSHDIRHNKYSKDLGRPSTSSSNQDIGQGNITGSRPQHLRHHRSRTMGEYPEPARYRGLDTDNRNSAPLSSRHRRTRNEVVPADASQQFEREDPDEGTTFKDRNSVPIYYEAATCEWPAQPTEGLGSVVTLEQPAYQGAFGKFKAFGDKIAKKFKEPKGNRTGLEKVAEAREKKERRHAEAARKHEQSARRSSRWDE